MISLFSSSSDEEQEEPLSKEILPPEDRDHYEAQYEELRETLQDLSTNIKMKSNVDTFSVPSASHDYDDLEELFSELERVEAGLRSNKKLCMVSDRIWLTRYCRHQIRSLQDHLEIEAEMENWGERF